jgi:MFS transporter, MHS family, proline/betaine transporter
MVIVTRGRCRIDTLCQMLCRFLEQITQQQRHRLRASQTAFNISVLVAGLTPTLAAWLVESSQNLMMPAYYLMVVAVVGLITGVTMKETANRPLKGATPAASDIQEAKEILVEHYDNIEQKIDDIDHEIADLQAKRTRLVQQHPRIDE